MAFLFGSTIGGKFEASLVDDTSYDPVYDTSLDANFLFNLLPSFYKDLMDDQETYKALWSGLMQATASGLLNLWQTDYAKSLRDIPVVMQRKWVEFTLVEDLPFSEDPGLSLRGQEGRYSYDSTEDVLTCDWQNRTGIDQAYITLKGIANEDASLSWSAQFNFSLVQSKGSALWGYFSSINPIALKNCLAAGVLGENSADYGALFLIHCSSVGTATFVRSTVRFELDTDYRIDCTYTARTGTAVATATELDALKTSGTGTTGEAEYEGVYTSELTDASVDFVELGVVVGDKLVVDSFEYTIQAVGTTQLIVTPSILPADATVSYEVRGEVEHSSVSINLRADAVDYTFRVDLFGTSNLDTRVITTTMFPTPGRAAKREVTGTTWGWRYLDPTVSDVLLTIPRLQDTITNPTTLLYEGIDYTIRYDADGSSLRFQEPPAERLWAEYAGVDDGTIYDNFGKNVGIEEIASDSYKSKVRGLYYSYFQGPTLYGLRTGVHILLGLPIADEAGTVEAINPSYSGVYGQITVAGRNYLYPLIVGTDLVVGDEVSLFQPLCLGVEVIDYINTPKWFVNISSMTELEKYHTFAMYLNLDAFSVDDLRYAASFVDIVKPTWKSVDFIAHKDLDDDLEIDDEISFKATLVLWDTVHEEAPLVRYDSHDYEGESADWRYDQGWTDWDETSGAMRGTATWLSGTAAFENGLDAVVGLDTLFLSEIGGPGVVSDKYIAVALYTEGTNGDTVAGVNFFTEGAWTAFEDVEVGDSIDVDGEGTFEVLRVISNTALELDAPMSSTASGVSWAVTGKLKIWGQVDSVTDDENLTLSTAFGGDDGNYRMALLDPNFKKVRYDNYSELGIEEELEFILYLSVGYSEIMLTGKVSFVDGGTTVTGFGTEFTTEIGPVGFPTDKYISTPDGTWYEVDEIISDTELTITVAADGDDDVVPTFLASDILAGTFTFNNGSPTVTATVSQTGVINVDDWIQIVPTQDVTDPVNSTPVVQVQAIDVPGTTITLTDNYSGINAAGVKVNKRCGGDEFPVSFQLPDSQTSLVTVTIDDWPDQGLGDHAHSIVAEPTSRPLLESYSLSLWLDAGFGVIRNAANLMREWVCRARTGLIAQQFTAADKLLYMPAALNNQPVARVLPSSTYMDVAGSAPLNVHKPAGFVIFVVAAPLAASTSELVDKRRSTAVVPAADGWILFLSGGNVPTFVVEDGLGNAVILTGVVITGYTVITVEIDPLGTMELFQDGVSVDTDTFPAGTQSNTELVRVGGSQSCFVAEVALFEGDLTPVQRAAIEDDLMAKYDL